MKISLNVSILFIVLFLISSIVCFFYGFIEYSFALLILTLLLPFIFFLEARRLYKFSSSLDLIKTNKKKTRFFFKELSSLYELINIQKEKIKVLEQVRSDFVANVSHELRTPITSIKGYVETLREGAYETRADLERFLEIIDRHSARLNAIISDLLNISRLESFQAEDLLELSETKLIHLIKSVIVDCDDLAVKKSIKIFSECDPDLTLNLDSSLMQQAILNLVLNAIRYSAEKTAITIKAERLKNAVKISVIDQGPGISTEHIPRLFERFYRVDKARSRDLGGTGLGLAIVKHIVSAHRGNVRVHSEVGKGSEFIIQVPL